MPEAIEKLHHNVFQENVKYSLLFYKNLKFYSFIRELNEQRSKLLSRLSLILNA